jgi:hypothetical protein
VGFVLILNAGGAGPPWTSNLVWPFFVVGVVVSGNPHQPSEPVVWLSMFLAAFLIFYAIGMIGRLLTGGLKGQKH